MTPCSIQSMEFSRPESGVGRLSLLQGIFPIQGSNPGLMHCRCILYQLSHQGSPKILGVGSLSLLQDIFLTQESNQGLLHCRRSLYQLSYQKSPYIYICLIKQLTRYLPIKFFNMREALLPSKGLPLNQTLLSIIVND